MLRFIALFHQFNLFLVFQGVKIFLVFDFIIIGLKYLDIEWFN
jgi:hypothetical protein